MLHSKGVIHRDIKPCNILLDDQMNLKIADFGTAKVFNCNNSVVNKALDKRRQREECRSNSPTKKHSFVGTNQYISPEMLKGDNPTYAIDLWSLGVLIYKLYTGFTPFAGYSEIETYDMICKGNISKSSAIPDDAWDLIKSLLKVNHRERLGCANVENKVDYLKIKSHPFFSGIEFGSLSYKHEEKKKMDVFETSSEVTREDADSVGRDSVDSISIPCIMDDDDFYENRFEGEVTDYILPKIQGPMKKACSEDNLSMFLREDHFHEKSKKGALKCDTNNMNVPVLFDELSTNQFSSVLNPLSPLVLLK